MTTPTYRKKLIEVALPLEAINMACQAEKSNPFLTKHPRRMHLYWARRPLAACRAVLFGSLVDDPSSHPEMFPTEVEQERERQRLFRLIEQMVLWENSDNVQVLNLVREEIYRATHDDVPIVLDPFSGGGSIPVEAQRLGLETHASDLNPLALLITKATSEIPSRFVEYSPVNPKSRAQIGHGGIWPAASGLATDIRYYGEWMQNEARSRIGHLYPKIRLGAGEDNRLVTVIAWLWARTVTCSNPGCGSKIPLLRSFALSTKKGKEARLDPFVDTTTRTVRFNVQLGATETEMGTLQRGAVTCLVCANISTLDYVRSEAQQGRMSVTPVAIVAQGNRERLYLPFDLEQEQLAYSARPEWKPEQLVTTPSHDVDRLPMYGMYSWGEAFTDRQLVGLTTLFDLVKEARGRVLADALDAGLKSDGLGLAEGGTGAVAYADAMSVYLSLACSRSTEFHNSLTSWNTGPENFRQIFARQAIPMVWDFAEANLLDGLVPFGTFLEYVSSSLEGLNPVGDAKIEQVDAAGHAWMPGRYMICTDPPYYDNIGYADLSDYFYVWLRHSLRSVYPELFNTLLVPKAQELVAAPNRFGGSRAKAKQFFEEGLGKAFERMRSAQKSAYPLTLFYAFKQAETDESDLRDRDRTSNASTGWETMLEGLLKAQFQITGTWPMRTERPSGVKASSNALASSIVLVCRPRPSNAPLTTRRDFINTLKRELPTALKNLQHGNIAPVDLAQASIGPGMSVFSRFSRVIESDGSPMRVRTALQLINQTLDQVLAEQEGEYDPDTRWAVAWFDQYAQNEGPYGMAETLSKAKNTSVAGLVTSGFLEARGGKVRLLKREELSENWDPTTDKRLTVWEVTQHLIRALDEKGEQGAAALLRKVGGQGEVARDLAYRLYTTCERKKWAQEAQAYNSLVVAWPQITQLASNMQGDMTQAGFA